MLCLWRWGVFTRAVREEASGRQEKPKLTSLSLLRVEPCLGNWQSWREERGCPFLKRNTIWSDSQNLWQSILTSTSCSLKLPQCMYSLWLTTVLRAGSGIWSDLLIRALVTHTQHARAHPLPIQHCWNAASMIPGRFLAPVIINHPHLRYGALRKASASL